MTESGDTVCRVRVTIEADVTIPTGLLPPAIPKKLDRLPVDVLQRCRDGWAAATGIGADKTADSDVEIEFLL